MRLRRIPEQVLDRQAQERRILQKLMNQHGLAAGLLPAAPDTYRIAPDQPRFFKSFSQIHVFGL
jgi:hypothetical protein